MTYSSELSLDLSPVRLSYVAALRGVKPLKPQESFSYAQIGAFTPFNFMALAASNPQGKFYAYLNDETLVKQATAIAAERHVTNATFFGSMDQLPKDLTYLCYESLSAKPTESEDVFKLAEEHLSEGGLLSYRYRAYQNQDECLRFLVEEYTPELSDEQALEFLSELKALGHKYFQDNAIALNTINNAIESKDPSIFFSACLPNDDTSMPSGTFEVMKGLLPRSFSFAGSADISGNYIQLAAPPEAHETLEKCKDGLLYEAIKDFTTGQCIRSDVWVRQPAVQTNDQAELFGFFTYGITTSREDVPLTISTKGTDIPLASPLFTRLIDLMCSLPMGIGDFLAHPSGEDMDPQEVVSAIQVLVACGLAKPMRTHYEGRISSEIEKPEWSTAYNDYLTNMSITETSVQLASPIVGSPMTIPARDALVLQAIHKVGMKNSAGILQPALQKIIDENPALAAQIIDTAEPTDDAVHAMLTSTISRSMLKWYAYGLIAA